MAKKAKQAPLQRKTLDIKRTSTKKFEGKSGLFKIPTHHYEQKYAHGIAGVNVMEPDGMNMNKSGDIMLGFVSGAPEENKSQRLELRLTKLQKDFISKASSVSGFKNVSDYILHIAISDSKNVIREQQIFELSERDRVSFMETLENPPEPGKNLKKAMASYLSFQEGK
ncbi:MAG: DUF1778 domain-containing protein [Bacteroidota bacterium]